MIIIKDMALYLTLTKGCEEFGIDYIKRVETWGIILVFQVPGQAMIIKFGPVGTRYHLYEVDNTIGYEKEIHQGDIYAAHLEIVQAIIRKHRGLRSPPHVMWNS